MSNRNARAIFPEAVDQLTADRASAATKLLWGSAAARQAQAVTGRMVRKSRPMHVGKDGHKARLHHGISAIAIKMRKPRGMFDTARCGVSNDGRTQVTFVAHIDAAIRHVGDVVRIAGGRIPVYAKLPAPKAPPALPLPPETGDLP